MIGYIIIPYSFVNNSEVADAVKVNSNFSVVTSAINELIADSNDLAGSRLTLSDRLSISINEDGTLKASALPVGTYDTRTRRIVTEDDVITEDDSILLVDTTAGNITLTLPPSATAVVTPIVVNIGKTGYSVTLEPDAGDTVMEQTEYVFGVAGEFAQFAVKDANWWRVR